jgi:hypothetical protein
MTSPHHKISTRSRPQEELSSMGACATALDWVKDQPDQTPQVLWNTCPRGDWLLWYAEQMGVHCSLMVLAACGCARLALPFVTPGDERPLHAIVTAEKWALGAADLSLVQRASAADAAAAYAAYAAYAAAGAAAAASAAAYAADAAAGAHAVDAAAAAAAARYHMLLLCAATVRAHIPYTLVHS